MAGNMPVSATTTRSDSDLRNPWHAAVLRTRLTSDSPGSAAARAGRGGTLGVRSFSPSKVIRRRNGPRLAAARPRSQADAGNGGLVGRLHPVQGRLVQRPDEGIRMFRPKPVDEPDSARRLWPGPPVQSVCCVGQSRPPARRGRVSSGSRALRGRRGRNDRPTRAAASPERSARGRDFVEPFEHAAEFLLALRRPPGETAERQAVLESPFRMLRAEDVFRLGHPADDYRDARVDDQHLEPLRGLSRDLARSISKR